MRFSADWQDDAVNLAPEERATVADLRLWLGQQNVCMHLRGSDAMDHVTIPLYSLAEGLAHDWWTLFGGRDSERSLIGYRIGFAVPDVRMSYDGNCFEYSARQRNYDNPDIRFWSGPSVVATRVEAEDQLTAFIECVLERLQSRDPAATSAALRWARVKASRMDADEAAFCEAVGALRLDPYQVEDSVAQTIEVASGLFEGECLTEFLAGASRKACQPLIEWVNQVEGGAPDKSRVADLQDAVTAVAAIARERSGEAAWARGYRRARLLRQVLGFDSSRRFATYLDVAKAVGAGRRYELAPAANGIRLLRSHRGPDVHLHLRTHGRSAEAQASHLFTIARGVGDVACFPDPQRAPVNELRSAYRQAAGRAFAAEFLAPVDEIRSMQDDGRDVIAIAETFAVSTEVIERQIENAERIEAACRADAVGLCRQQDSEQ